MQTTLILILLLLAADIQLLRPAVPLPASNATSDSHNGNHNHDENQSTLLPQPSRETPPDSATPYDGDQRAATRGEKFQTLVSSGRPDGSRSEVSSSSLAPTLILSSTPSQESGHSSLSSLKSAAFSQGKRNSEDEPLLMQNRLSEENGRFENSTLNSTSPLEGNEISAKRKSTTTTSTTTPVTKMEAYSSNTIVKSAITLEKKRSSANSTLAASTLAEEVSEGSEATLSNTTTPRSGDNDASTSKKENSSLTLVIVSIVIAALFLSSVFAITYSCCHKDAGQTQGAEAMQLMNQSTTSSGQSQTQNPGSPSYGVPQPADKGQDDVVMSKKTKADDVMTYKPDVANYECGRSGLGASGQGAGPDASDPLLWPPPAVQGAMGAGV